MGRDDIQAFVYKNYWDILGGSLVNVVQNFFKTGYLNIYLNKTFITFIEKVDNPSLVHQFKPINLCNAIYKVISTILSNGLKGKLKNFISPFQYAFIPNRWIFYNVIVT